MFALFLLDSTNMKSFYTALMSHKVRFLILIAIVTLLGYLLFQYYQPLCEPCLLNTYCPPCRSKEQHAVKYITWTIDVLISFRYFHLMIPKWIKAGQ
ncbi:hypothetical protein SAMN06265350_10582 [Solitalea koreensis]|uniref:Uncharacterized protein n=1 Tax=Solitalea koreensis TaxID=543615 RepID=A0A521D052_9SPHI|nr:hypothetical protein SAMN06265350_10582 [Solitalea koreensis]